MVNNGKEHNTDLLLKEINSPSLMAIDYCDNELATDTFGLMAFHIMISCNHLLTPVE